MYFDKNVAPSAICDRTIVRATGFMTAECWEVVRERVPLGRRSHRAPVVTPLLRPLVAALVAGTLGGCATTVDRYGTSYVGVGLFGFCDPAALAMDWPTDVPELRTPERREIEPRVAALPELRPLRGALELGGWPSDAPELRAPARPDLPARSSDPLTELPPTRGAPWLPATTLDVPALLAPERRDIGTRAPPDTDLRAPARPSDVGFGYEPATDESHACTRALALASISCRMASRADLREPSRRNP